MVDRWLSLLPLLETVFTMGVGKDRRIWEIDSYGYFSVQSFCKKLLLVGVFHIYIPKFGWGSVLLK